MDTDELQDLYSSLETPFDFDGLLGVLHAVACAPNRIAPERWLGAVMPESTSPGPSRPSVMPDVLRAGLLKQYDEVEQALAEGAAFIPDPEEDEAWESFARGYLAGAALDAEWAADPERWSVVSWLAYLAGLRQHVTPELLAELDAEPNASDIICDQAPAMIRAIYAEFRLAEKATPGASRAAAHGPRGGQAERARSSRTEAPRGEARATRVAGTEPRVPSPGSAGVAQSGTGETKRARHQGAPAAVQRAPATERASATTRGASYSRARRDGTERLTRADHTQRQLQSRKEPERSRAATRAGMPRKPRGR